MGIKNWVTLIYFGFPWCLLVFFVVVARCFDQRWLNLVLESKVLTASYPRNDLIEAKG